MILDEVEVAASPAPPGPDGDRDWLTGVDIHNTVTIGTDRACRVRHRPRIGTAMMAVGG